MGSTWLQPGQARNRAKIKPIPPLGSEAAISREVQSIVLWMGDLRRRSLLLTSLYQIITSNIKHTDYYLALDQPSSNGSSLPPYLLGLSPRPCRQPCPNHPRGL